jgi:hypothetical protein
MFPRINPRLTSPVSIILLTLMDYCVATMISAVAIAIGWFSTGALWKGCVHVFQHWYLVFQLPYYWVAFVTWLLILLLCCVIFAVGCIIYKQGWQWTCMVFSAQ